MEFLITVKQTINQLLGITIENTSSNYVLIWALQLALEASRFEWCALRNHVTYMRHVIQNPLGYIIANLGESWPYEV
jgi:hypothetical protein